jgi:hypothetical protein
MLTPFCTDRRDPAAFRPAPARVRSPLRTLRAAGLARGRGGVALLLACVGCGAPPHRGPPPAELAPPPPRALVLELGSPPSRTAVELVVRNEGSFALELPQPLRPFVRVTRVHGVTRRACSPALPPDRVGWLELRPGETTRVVVDVDARCVFADPPPARVMLEVDVPPGLPAVRDRPGAWIGRSAAVIVVLPAAEPVPTGWSR